MEYLYSLMAIAMSSSVLSSPNFDSIVVTCLRDIDLASTSINFSNDLAFPFISFHLSLFSNWSRMQWSPSNQGRGWGGVIWQLPIKRPRWGLTFIDPSREEVKGQSRDYRARGGEAERLFRPWARVFQSSTGPSKGGLVVVGPSKESQGGIFPDANLTGGS